MEEGRHVARYRRWLLGWSEVPAAWIDGPALNVVHALQMCAGWLALGNGLVCEDSKRCRRSDVAPLDGVPAIVPVVSHRRGYGLCSPIQSECGAEKLFGRRHIAP